MLPGLQAPDEHLVGFSSMIRTKRTASKPPFPCIVNRIERESQDGMRRDAVLHRLSRAVVELFEHSFDVLLAFTPVLA